MSIDEKTLEGQLARLETDVEFIKENFGRQVEVNLRQENINANASDLLKSIANTITSINDKLKKIGL